MSTYFGIKNLAVGRADIYRIEIANLHIKPGWNSRDLTTPENVYHIDILARSISEVGVKEPLTVAWEDGMAYVTNGHCRYAATLRAIEVYGADIKSVPVKTEERFSSEADRVFSQIVRNSGKPLAPYESAVVFKKLLDLGWSEKDISTKSGLTAAHVRDLLTLLAAPAAVTSLVRAGSVSSTLAMQVIKSSGGDGAAAAVKLTEAVGTAKAAGKIRATSKHLNNPPPRSKPVVAPKPDMAGVLLGLLVRALNSADDPDDAKVWDDVAAGITAARDAGVVISKLPVAPDYGDLI